MPKVEDPSDGLEETAQANDANPSGAAAAEQQEDKTQQYIDQISKLKGEIKRLRQELILKGPSKRRQQMHDEYDSEDDSQAEGILDDEERAALRLLSPD